MRGEWEPRPLPKVTPETERFWRGCAEKRLLLLECSECGVVFYYPRTFCPECGGGKTDWIEADGEGVVYSFSWMDEYRGWPDSGLPLVVAYVELSEGPRLFTNIVGCDPGDLEIGDRVRVDFVSTEDEDIAVPVFTQVD